MPLELDALLQPIAGDDPGGADVRYEPIFLELREARTEEDDLPSGDWSRERKVADWKEVVALGSTILKDHAKDMQVVAWLAEGLLHREGVAGLAQGLALAEALLEAFWDHLHPRIEDEEDLEFRAAPLEWVGSYLGPHIRMLPMNTEGHTLQAYRLAQGVGYERDMEGLEAVEGRREKVAEGMLTPEEFDEAFEATPKAFYRERVSELDAAIEAVDSLQSRADEAFGRYAPRFSPLRDVMVEVRQAADQFLKAKLKVDPDPVEEAPVEPISLDGEGDASGTGTGDAGGAGGAQAPAGGAAGAAVSAGPPGSRGDAEARIAQAARFLRKDDPTDPSSYLLLRGFRWGELRRKGDGIDPRLLEAPPTALRSQLRSHLLDGRWAPLLEGAEEVMASPYGRGWLDLQRYVLEACQGLGASYDPVAHGIREALRALVSDLPSILDATLMDDTPTANGETRRWMEELGIRRGENGEFASPPTYSSGGSGSGGRGRDPWDAAMERVAAGKPEEAIHMLIQQSEQERSARARFLRRSQAAEIMVNAGRAPVARPILEELVQEIADHNLETYEAGETVAAPLSLLYRCMRDMGEDDSEVRDLYLRICRLDPMMAIKIERPESS